MAIDLFIEIPHSEYGDGVILNEYNGTFSIVAAKKGKDGKPYMQWGFPQGKDRLPREKPLPIKINLGDRNAATATLKALYFAINPKE
jgi:hypothetical protein